ncbi:MAG TPA: DUF2339 domain-containing protein [Pyrinomonadaceae bacterium]|nr:DUF2339 domain-containing protein [Pyrinomonadaceae bacterium]
MSEFDEKIERLQARLENLLKSQEDFQTETRQIRNEIDALRQTYLKQNPDIKPPAKEYIPPGRTEQTTSQKANQRTARPTFENAESRPKSPVYDAVKSAPKEKSDIEKFIGENLISKIGIVILILGVAIGAKYAIDNDLISPLTRIFLGYAFGFGLLGFAIKLKEKYLNFSAVLMSGAMAIMYFITFFAYSLYELFSQSAAFALMLIFTVFTVAAAVNYSRQVIAHIGLVGAYAVPFLLSDNSGKVPFLFSYIAIINLGILAVSVKKYWKSLYYSSFVVTWLIFGGWYVSQYRTAENFNFAFLFLTINFLTFYLTFIAYKLISKQSVAVENIALILANSFIFYGVGYSIIGGREGFADYLGLFTVGNAAIHCAFAFAAGRLKDVPRDLIYLLGALVLTFATIAVPVQFDGNIVTLIWSAEAAILFWIGRAKQISLYENYSYPLMLLASISLLNDWQILYRRFYLNDAFLDAFFNPFFAVGLFFVAAFAFIDYTNRNKNYEPLASPQLAEITRFAIPVIFLGALYNVFRVEIGNYYHSQVIRSAVSNAATDAKTIFNDDLNLYNIVWQINYTMLFLAVLSFVIIKKLKNSTLALVNIGLNALVLVVFLAGGLYVLGELRASYLGESADAVFAKSAFNIIIRYISYAFAAGLIYAIYKYLKQDFIEEKFTRRDSIFAFDFIFHVSLLWILSSELVNLTDVFGYKESYKLGLSILWGIYALFLIVLGINRNKKHLRVGAIILFGLTLAKIFFYDIADLTTISKTVVFISLGIIMLIVSFLYNKYKHLIFDAQEADAADEI